MAQREQDREDLLHEATALTSRAEFAACGFAKNIVIGFRAGGAASLLIGADPVYQFNSNNQLRRGFRDGRMIKAVDSRLFELRRERADGQVQLLRREFDAADTESYLVECRGHLDTLRDRLQRGQYELVGQVSDDGDVVARITEWLEALPAEIAIAAKPNVG